MIGRARVPRCLFKRPPIDWFDFKFNMFTLKQIKKQWSVIPLHIVDGIMLLVIPAFIYNRAFVTTIDVQFTDYQRFEIPSVPKFIDLRNPQTMKIYKVVKFGPAVHLDNRYRLMRNEPMLDADGKETDQIGEDETAPRTIKSEDKPAKPNYTGNYPWREPFTLTARN